jgi:DNA-binding NarL/FixJ family response regulator
MTNSDLNMTVPIAPPSSSSTKAVCVCDTQPVTGVAIRTLLGGHAALDLTESVDSLSDGFEFARGNPTSVLLIDKAFGITAICESLIDLHESQVIAPIIVVWGATVWPADAMRFLHAGVRGILRKNCRGSGVDVVFGSSGARVDLGGGLHLASSQTRRSPE